MYFILSQLIFYSFVSLNLNSYPHTNNSSIHQKHKNDVFNELLSFQDWANEAKRLSGLNSDECSPKTLDLAFLALSDYFLQH